MDEGKIEIGQQVKDKESTFAGKVVGRAEYLYGLPQLFVATGDVVDGKPVERWIAEGQVDVLPI